MRLWWNGIHNRLKICRGNLAGSNPANRTTKMTAHEAVFFVAKGIGRDLTERRKNTAVRCFSARRLCGTADCALRSTSKPAGFPPPQRNPANRTTKMTAHEAVFFVAKGIGRDYSARTVSSVLKPFSSTLCSASGTLSYPSNTRSQDLPLLYTWTGAPAFRYRFEMQRS